MTRLLANKDGIVTARPDTGQLGGTLVEIFRDGVACYCLAGLPSPHMKDLKGLLVEQSFKHVKSAEGLYDSIPSIEPLAMDAFEPIPGRPGMWKLKAMQELEARPRFE